jgi:Nickel responsive protein SCO4226-like
MGASTSCAAARRRVLATMTDVVLERRFDQPLTAQAVLDLASDGAGCLARYRVNWYRSLLASDGRSMVCLFAAPDAESVRVGLRQAGADVTHCWAGSIHDAPSAPPLATANVLVQRGFAAPVELADIQAIEDAGAWCLEVRGVEFVRTYFARDCRRMVCLYRAPDAEAVRAAQREAKVPFDRVWAYQSVEPAGS